MRKVFIALAFVAIIVSSTMLPEVRLKAAASFAQLQKSKVGKNILTAIQLELSSKNTETAVDRILVLLNDLLNDTNDTLTETQDNLQSTSVDCAATTASYEDQISGKEAQIAQGNVDLPNLNLALASAQVNLQTEQDQLQQAENDLADANDADGAASAAYAKSTRNHNSMVAALTQARALIATLKASSFVQKTSNQILAQITSHTQASMASLASHPARDIFQVLMQMAQEVGIQSDQELVGSILDIIDDLLSAEADALDAEATAEAERQVEYAALVANLNDEISTSTNNILDLQSQIVSLGNDIDTLTNDLANWNDQLNSLNETLAAHNNLCASEIQQLNEDIDDLTSEIDVVQQVIAIFESDDIQDVKDLVEATD